MTTAVDPARRARFAALVAECGEPAQRYLRRRADPDTADDVLSEVLLVCWRRLDEIPVDALPWVSVVAGNCLANARRAARRRERLVQRIRVVDPPPPSSSARAAAPRLRGSWRRRPSGPTTSCAVLTAEGLAMNLIAFAAAVRSVDDDEVVLAVTERFREEVTDEVVVAQGTDPSLEYSTGEFVAGGDYLVAITDGAAASCGLTGLESPELRALYEEAFAG